MPTILSEKEFETLIVSHLRDVNGYNEGKSTEYAKDLAMIPERLQAFIMATQEKKVIESFCFASELETNRFFRRLSMELEKRGVTDVLRKGFRYNNALFDLYYPIPSEQNESAKVAYAQNDFTVVRQLHYSQQNTDLSIDVVLFLNGLPIITMELKNHYTGQTVQNAIYQYQHDRDAKELLLKPKRCAVHLAVDDDEVFFCAELKNKDSWFLPFNRGNNGGAGNPLNPNGLRTAYLWEEVLTKRSLSNILENYAQLIVTENVKTHVRTERMIWPRYHQLACVNMLVEQTLQKPVGQRFLIQHSAGSGKSNSISWLAYQLVMLVENDRPKFDSVILVTDRVNLDRQLRNNILSFKKMQNVVAWAEDSLTLNFALSSGKKIIVTTIHKFTYVLDAIEGELHDRHFAVIIDEAHSSQSGSMSANMQMVLQSNNETDKDSEEYGVEEEMIKVMKGRKMAKNANFYAFTATPKDKTLALFGQKTLTPEGKEEFRPHHVYPMQQAVQEGFILDVLSHYTIYDSYYNLIAAEGSNEEELYDAKKAQGKLRAYVERQPKTIEKKSQIIVEHLCTKVVGKIGGKARAMLVCPSIQRAIEYYWKISGMLKERKSPYRAIVAFSGEKVIDDKAYTEESLNGFPSLEIEKRMKDEPYRLLIVANKFQTGYDEPLLHTMYVDKQLSDVKAVQTLSRLNRCCPKKIDTFVLDFANDAETIQASFQKFYKATYLNDRPDPNRLNDLLQKVQDYAFFTDDDVLNFNKLYWAGADRKDLEPILNTAVDRFKTELDEHKQIDCKGAIKGYVRAYPFLASILPYESSDWERHYVFLNLLLDKLPKLKAVDEDDMLIENVDFDKYRIVKQEERKIDLEDKDTGVDPVQATSAAKVQQKDMETLHDILDEFNQRYGNIEWLNRDKVKQQIEQLPDMVASDQAFQNAARHSDVQTAMLQCGNTLMMMVARLMQENTEFARTFFDNKDFQNMITQEVFHKAYSTIVNTGK